MQSIVNQLNSVKHDIEEEINGIFPGFTDDPSFKMEPIWIRTDLKELEEVVCLRPPFVFVAHIWPLCLCFDGTRVLIK